MMSQILHIMYSFFHLNSSTPTERCWERMLHYTMQRYEVTWQPVLDVLIWRSVIFLFVGVGLICGHLEFCWFADDLEIWRNVAEAGVESADHFLCMWWQGHSAWGCKYVCPIVAREQNPHFGGSLAGNRWKHFYNPFNGNVLSIEICLLISAL